MSWANRNLPRKRDISQIPEPFRPHIVPRVDRPEVVASEAYQTNPINEIVYPDDMQSYFSLKPSKAAEPVIDRRQYPIKKIELPRANLKELIYNGKSYVFVILRNIRQTRDNDLWISSYNSIRQFYTNKIVIIDDNSTINTVDGKLVNTETIRSEYNGAGEILPYLYFMKHKWADRMIFIHDSMFINRPFRDAELDGSVTFHWHFDAKEDNKLGTYLSLLKNSTNLVEYATQITKWKACFGGASIIDLETIVYLEEAYAFFTKLVMVIRNRKDREMFERLFGIVLFHEGILNMEHFSNFGNILKYPKAFESDHTSIDTAKHILSQANYDTAIIKVWRGR